MFPVESGQIARQVIQDTARQAIDKFSGDDWNRIRFHLRDPFSSLRVVLTAPRGV